MRTYLTLDANNVVCGQTKTEGTIQPSAFVVDVTDHPNVNQDWAGYRLVNGALVAPPPRAAARNTIVEKLDEILALLRGR